MSAEWARAALVSLGCTQSGLIPRLLRSRLCRWRTRSSLALSFIFPPPQVLTTLAASASSGSTAETSTAPTVANTTAAMTTMAFLKTIESPSFPSFETLRRTLHYRRLVLKHLSNARWPGPTGLRPTRGGPRQYFCKPFGRCALSSAWPRLLRAMPLYRAGYSWRLFLQDSTRRTDIAAPAHYL